MDQDQGRAIARVLSTVLGKLVVANDTRAQETGEAPPITKFHALRAPSISIYDYVERIFKYAACSSECFVLALIYIDRIIQRQGFVINSLNVHRVVITSIMLAAKFFDDHYFKNGFYAKVGGVPCNEMNSLEVEFLFLLNFSLHVPPETYKKYYVELCNHAQSLPSVDTLPPPLEFTGMYGELKFVDENSVEKSPDSVQQTPDGSSGAGSKSFTTGSNSGGGGGKTGGGSGGSGGRKTGGSTWTIGQGSPQAPETSHPVAMPSPDRQMVCSN